MARLSLIGVLCSLFLNGTVLAQEIEEQFNHTRALYQKIEGLQALSYDVYTRSFAPDVPGVSGGIPTTEEFQNIDMQFEEVRDEVNTYLSTSQYELLAHEDYSSMVTNKVLLIAKTHAVALEILISKIYSGLRIDNLNINRYNLTIPTGIFNEMSGSNLKDSFSSSNESGLTIIEEANENIILKVNPSILAGYKIAVETSQDTDQSFSKLVRYPIIQLYFNSILNSQRLRGIENPKIPTMASLEQSDYETTTMFPEIWQKTLEEERENIFRRAVYEAITEIMFKVPVSNVTEYALYNDLTLNQFIDATVNSEWQDLIIANDSYISAFNQLNIPKLEYQVTDLSLQIAEFSEFSTFVEHQIQSWPSKLSCPSLNTCLENESLKAALVDIFASAKSNTQYAQLMPFEDMFQSEFIDSSTGESFEIPRLTQTEHNSIFGNSGFVQLQLESRKLDLIVELYNSDLLTSWISKIRQKADLLYEQQNLEFVHELMEISQDLYDLLWLLDENTPIDADILYETIGFQKNLQIDTYTQGWMDFILEQSDSYNDAKQTFHQVIQSLASEVLADSDTLKSNNEEQLGVDRVNQILAIDTENTDDNVFEQAGKTRATIALRELSQLGYNMGFYLTQEETNEPGLRGILSNLPDPDRGGIAPNPFSYLKNRFTINNSQWYENRYQQIYRTRELNETRLLDKKFSPDENKNIYEIIYELCTDETPHWEACIDDVKNVVNPAMILQEAMAEEELNKLIQESDIDNTIKIVQSSGVLNTLNNQAPEQLDFHLARLNEHMELGNTEATFGKVTENLLGATNIMFYAWILRLVSGALPKWLPKAGARGFTSFIESFWMSAGPVVTGHFIALIPITAIQVLYSRNQLNNEVKPNHEIRENLYYSTLGSNEIMDLMTLELSEKEYEMARFANNAQVATIGAIALILTPAIIGGLTGIKMFEPVLNRTSKLIFGAKEKKITEALKSLGINPGEFDWNIAKLKAMSGLTPAQTRAIRTIERFHNTYHRSFINHARALGPLKERYNINPFEIHPDIIKLEINKAIQASSSRRVAELRALEKSLTSKHIILRQRAKNSLLMRNLLNRLQNMRLGFAQGDNRGWINGKIVELSRSEPRLIEKTITRNNLTINGKKITVISG